MNCKEFLGWIRRYDSLLSENINDYHMTKKEAVAQAEEDIMREFEDCVDGSGVYLESLWARGG